MADETPPYCDQYHHCQVFLSNDAVEKHGWLNKQGGNLGQWRRRWFVQSNNYLFYFKSPQDSEPRGSIPLEEVEVIKHEQGGTAEQGVFLVQHKDNFSYYLQSEDGPEDVDEWVESIKWAKYSALKAGYFRLDDINAKLKEQLRQKETFLQQERERSAELEQECDRLRRSGGGGGAAEGAAQLLNAQEIEQLKDQLRQAERERDQAQRQAASGSVAHADDDCFEPTRSDFRVLVYRERYDDSNIMGELFLRPDCTFAQVRQIIAEDLGQDGAVQLIHGHLGDPMGRSGNLLGPEFDRSSIQEVFSDHDAEMLIVQPDSTGRARSWRRAEPATAQLEAPVAAPEVAGSSLPARVKQPSVAAAAAADGGADGARAVRVPVYWQSNDEANRRGDVAIYEEDTVGDVRARIASQGLSGGEEVSMKRRKVPMMPRNDGQPARKYFSSEADYVVLF